MENKLLNSLFLNFGVLISLIFTVSNNAMSQDNHNLSYQRVFDIYCEFQPIILFSSATVSKASARELDLVFYFSSDSTNFISILAAKKGLSKIARINLNKTNFMYILNMRVKHINFDHFNGIKEEN